MEDLLLSARNLNGDDQRVVLVLNAERRYRLVEHRLRAALGLGYLLHVALLHTDKEGVSGLRWQVLRFFDRYIKVAHWALNAPVARAAFIALLLQGNNLLVEVQDALGQLALALLELELGAEVFVG